MKKIMAFVLVAIAAAASARAQGVAAGVKVGTLGIGADVTGYLTPQLNARVGINYASFTIKGEADDVDYDVDLDFLVFMGLLDWHPYENNFRVSAGVCLNNNKFDMTGENLDQSTDIGDNEYSSDEIGTLEGKATFDTFAPYIGIGYGNAVTDDTTWSFSFDLGLMFQGSADVELTADGTAANDPQFQADLKEEEEDAQDVADDLQIYPVISFGMSYYFW